MIYLPGQMNEENLLWVRQQQDQKYAAWKWGGYNYSDVYDELYILDDQARERYSHLEYHWNWWRK